MNIMTVGPFTWKLRDPRKPDDDEVWALVVPENVPLGHWVIKNYGNVPGPGFNGWKLVSAGPFDSAGAYSSREDAMQGVIPWLTKQINDELQRKVNELTAMRDAINKFLTK